MATGTQAHRHRSYGTAAAVASVLLFAVPSWLGAQVAGPRAPAGPSLLLERPAPELLRTPSAHPLPELFRTPAGAFTASLLLPGAGQLALGERRWVLYGAAEAVAWLVRLEARGAERDAVQGYRDVAWEQARLQVEPRRDGSWGYYETMSEYTRSGRFDQDPALPGVQPESDEATYNGGVWSLARSIYLPGGAGAPGSDEYEQALEFYRGRAAGPAFLWSWAGKGAALDRFRGLIDDADTAARRANGALGALLANHLVSAVDAFIVARIHSSRPIRLESRLIPADPVRWTVGVRISH